jgi:hypothetical protein
MDTREPADMMPIAEAVEVLRIVTRRPAGGVAWSRLELAQRAVLARLDESAAIEIDERAEPQTYTLHPGQRYQFRGVFVIEHDERQPVEITWQRVVDDPYERDLGREERQVAELDAARARVAELEGEDERLRGLRSATRDLVRQIEHKNGGWRYPAISAVRTFLDGAPTPKADR